MKQAIIAMVEAVVMPIFVGMQHSSPTRPFPILRVKDGGVNARFSRNQSQSRNNKFRARLNKKMRD